jgi:hypothetical protein
MMFPPGNRDPEPALHTIEELQMVCMKLLQINKALIRETRRNLWRGDFKGTIDWQCKSLVVAVLCYVESNGPALEPEPEPEAGVSRLERPSDVIKAILDLADSDMDMVQRAYEMEPAVEHVRVHGLIEELYCWRVLHP